MDLATRVEKEIRRRCSRDGFLWPDYQEYGLPNLSATLLRLLGAGNDAHSPLPSPIWEPYQGIQRIILLVVDALGYGHFQRVARQLPDVALSPSAGTGRFLPLTSVFPSTTATALSTLHSGLEPAEHGILGYRMLIPELDVVANMIKFAPATDDGPDLLERGLDPVRFFGVETVYDRLRAAGVRATSVVNKRFQGSGLTRMLHRGEQIVHLAATDLAVRLRHWLQETAGQRAYLYAYWDLTDVFGHEYGPDTEEVDVELRTFLLLLQRELFDTLSVPQARDCLFVFTSDHGQTAVSLADSVPLLEHPELQSRLRALPAGGSRATYLYLKPGETDFVRDYFERHLSHAFAVLGRREAIEMGLFGERPFSTRALARLGDLIVLGKTRSTLFYPFKPDRKRIEVKGIHGGLSEEEMLVPCVFLPLESTL